MKNIFTTIVLLFCVFLGSIKAINPIDSKTISKLDMSVFSHSKIQLETAYGRALILNPESLEELRPNQITKISLIYTTYREVDKFDQEKLNKNRWSNLQKLIPSLSENEDIKLLNLGVDQYSEKNRARHEFHGFIIEYKSSQFHYTNLAIQHHHLEGDREQSIQCQNGSKIDIPAHAFIDFQGNAIIGSIDLQVREALNPLDIIQGDLMTVTDKGEFLESGGMIQIQAFQNNKELKLKNDKSLIVEIPDLDGRKDMKAWEGEWENGKLQWNEPKDLLKNDDVQSEVKTDLIIIELPLFANLKFIQSKTLPGSKQIIAIKESPDYEKVRTKGLFIKKIIPFVGSNKKELYRIDLIAKEGNKSFLKSSYSKEAGIKSGLSEYQAKEIKEWFDWNQVSKAIETEFWGWIWSHKDNKNLPTDWFDPQTSMNNNQRIGTNLHIPDQNISRTLRMSNLGWANIDRFFRLKNNEIAQLEINCTNDNDEFISNITLIIPVRNMYIPGYRMKKGNYSFTHGDYEKNVRLPKGEKAIVVLTNEANDKTYSVIKEIKLGENEVEDLSLVERDIEETNSILKDILQ